MLPEIKIAMNRKQLFEAQARTGARLKAFKDVQDLEDHEYNKLMDMLRDYAMMLEVDILKNYSVEEKKEEPEKPPAEPMPKGRLHEDIRQAGYVGYAPKEKVAAMFPDNFRKAFGREFKKEA